MATSQSNSVIDQLRRAAILPAGADLPDEQLLRSFLEHRDEAAFEALVRRHGPMVLGVCRRVLRDLHNAEDCFQATFLVLARKAASIKSRELLANWLYGVAHNISIKARALAVKRQARERQVAQMPEPKEEKQDLGDDLECLLDQELSRLPEQFRVPIVLCELQGKSRKEAARQLGLPEGTLSSRLTRARAMLSKRMARHGVALSGVSLAAALSRNTASGSVPTTLVSSTVRAACQFAAGQAVTAGVISGQGTALTEGMLKTMLVRKLKSMGALLVLGSFLAGGGWLTHFTAAARQGEAEEKKDAETDALKQERRKFEGTWRPVSLEVDGKPLAGGKFGGLLVCDAEGRWKLQTDEAVTQEQGTSQIDVTRDPRTIDNTVTSDGDRKGKTLRAIYEFVNKDCFRLCLAGSDKERPAAFSTKPGSGFALFVLQRVKPMAKDEEKPKRPDEEPEPKDTKVQALLKERLATLREISAMTEKLNKESGTVPVEEVLQAKLQLHRAELDLCESDKERVKVHEKFVQVAKELEAILNQRFKAGNITPVDALKAKANRLEAEIALERAKAKAAPQAK